MELMFRGMQFPKPLYTCLDFPLPRVQGRG